MNATTGVIKILMRTPAMATFPCDLPVEPAERRNMPPTFPPQPLVAASGLQHVGLDGLLPPCT